MHVAVVVDDGSGNKSVVDLDADDRNGASRFLIYTGSNFSSDPIIVLADARIRPDLNSGSFAFGYHAAGEHTKALYITNDGPMIYAGVGHHTYMLNVQTGKRGDAELAYAFHAKRWTIEIPDGTGNYTALREITA